MRRTTLGDIDINRQSYSRMSISKPTRQSLYPMPTTTTTTTTTSTMQGRTSMAPRNSIAPTQGRTSIAPNQGRLSVAAQGRPSMAPSKQSMGQAWKDPRNIRDPAFREQCARAVFTFLSQSGFERELSMRMLTAPTGRDFEDIFIHLYHLIDPSYVFQPPTKVSDDVLILLRALKYFLFLFFFYNFFYNFFFL